MPGTSCGYPNHNREAVPGIFQQLSVEPVPFIPDTWDPDTIKPGHKVGQASYLFTQIKVEKAEQWREAYGGEEARRLKALEAERKAAQKEAKEKEKAKKAAKKKAAAGTAGIQGETVEAAEKREMADPAIEKMTQAMDKTEVHTS